MVIQRGQESSPRRSSDVGGYTGSSSSGWSDGPWWRDGSEKRHIGAVRGLVEGTKLARVGAESYAQEYYSAQGGLEEAAKQATEVLSESNPTRSSDIFLAFQAVNHTAPEDLSGGSASSEQGKKGETDVVEPATEAEELISFAIYLHDPIHGITYKTLTQSVPAKWIEWLDASSESGASDANIPEEIADIINTGGVDPREWAAEWVEEVLALGVGVVAQRYVARRMGVGIGGLGRGKGRQEAVENGGGEAARAV